jgi:hypothetical protein
MAHVNALTTPHGPEQTPFRHVSGARWTKDRRENAEIFRQHNSQRLQRCSCPAAFAWNIALTTRSIASAMISPGRSEARPAEDVMMTDTPPYGGVKTSGCACISCKKLVALCLTFYQGRNYAAVASMQFIALCQPPLSRARAALVEEAATANANGLRGGTNFPQSTPMANGPHDSRSAHNKPIPRAACSNSSRNAGCAIAIISLARCLTDLPRSCATPNSVIT